jgi:hypothetical protein
MANWHLTAKSGNRKTGPIAVTTSSAETCPRSCPLRSGDCQCYAQKGPLRLHWDKVTQGKRGTSFAQHCLELRILPADRMVRLNQAGDLPGDGEKMDLTGAMKLCQAASAKGRIAWGYTHYHDLYALKLLNSDTGATINVSAPSLRQAALAERAGVPAVAIAEEFSVRWTAARRSLARPVEREHLCAPVRTEVT